MIKTKTEGEGEVLLTWTPSCADLKLIRISLVSLSAAFAITVFTPKGEGGGGGKKKQQKRQPQNYYRSSLFQQQCCVVRTCRNQSDVAQQSDDVKK
jgi:hypothetical protein